MWCMTTLQLNLVMSYLHGCETSQVFKVILFYCFVDSYHLRAFFWRQSGIEYISLLSNLLEGFRRSFCTRNNANTIQAIVSLYVFIEAQFAIELKFCPFHGNLFVSFSSHFVLLTLHWLHRLLEKNQHIGLFYIWDAISM